VYAGLFMYGLPEARPMLGAPPANTLAAASGVHAGDTVRAIDGEAIMTWQELRWRVLQAALQREPVKLETIDERGHISVVTLDLSGFPAADVESDVLERVGLRLHRPPLPPVLGQIVAGGAAERGGRPPRAPPPRGGPGPGRAPGGVGHSGGRPPRPRAGRVWVRGG